MPTFIALLRGVNVGRGRRIPMADLRKLLVGLGYTDVATVLNSGNAVFRASGGAANTHAASIAASIANRLRIDVPVIVKSASELAAIVAENPIAAAPSEHARVLVAMTQQPKTLSGLSVIETLVAPPERFVISKHAAYFFAANGILKSKAGEALLGKVGRDATTRNLATTLKLRALAAGPA